MLKYRSKCVKTNTFVSHKGYSSGCSQTLWRRQSDFEVAGSGLPQPIVSSRPGTVVSEATLEARNGRVLNTAGWFRSCILSPFPRPNRTSRTVNGTAQSRRGSCAAPSNSSDRDRIAVRQLRPDRGSRPAPGRHDPRSGRARRLRRHRHSQRRRSQGDASATPAARAGGRKSFPATPRRLRAAGRVAASLRSRRAPGHRRVEFQGAQRRGVESQRATRCHRAVVGRCGRGRSAGRAEPGIACVQARRGRPWRRVGGRARAVGERDDRPLPARCRAPLLGRSGARVGGHRRARVVPRAREPVAARGQSHVSAHLVVHPAGAGGTRAAGRARCPAAPVFRARGVSAVGHVAWLRRRARAVCGGPCERGALPVRHRAAGF